MTYTYKCENEECTTKQVDIDKPMSECSRTEHCSECGHELYRVYITNVNLMFEGSYNNSNKK